MAAEGNRASLNNTVLRKPPESAPLNGGAIFVARHSCVSVRGDGIIGRLPLLALVYPLNVYDTVELLESIVRRAALG